jgi:hypothetical protein
VTEGEKLEIYCDIHGVDEKEFQSGTAIVAWTKGIHALSM